MGKFRMSWSRLLSTDSQRPRTNRKNNLSEDRKIQENKHRYFHLKRMILYVQDLHIQ